jgi:hypothetical protein
LNFTDASAVANAPGSGIERCDGFLVLAFWQNDLMLHVKFEFAIRD